MRAALQRGGLSRPLRVLAAALIVVFGGVHLVLWAQESRDVKVIGILFLLNAVAAVGIAVALLAKPLGAFALGGLGLSLLTLVAFGLSRTIGLFGFAEHELGGRSAMVAAAAEVGAIVVLGLWYRATWPRRVPRRWWGRGRSRQRRPEVLWWWESPLGAAGFPPVRHSYRPALSQGAKMTGRPIAVPAVLVGVGLLLVAGCSSSSGGGTTTTTAAAAPTTTAAAAPTTTAGAAAGPAAVTLVAQGISWKTTKLAFKADQKVTVTVQNKDTVEHNFTFAAAKANKDVEKGETVTVAFTAPGPGTYQFHCKYHPKQMVGTVTIT